MVNHLLKSINIKPLDSGFVKKKKRKTLTSAQRIYIWERPNIYGRNCSICHRRINRLSDLELDHTRAYSKGGTKLALAHKDCNRIKSSGSLKEIQKALGIKSNVGRKPAKAKKINNKKDNFWINPVTGRKERFNIMKI